jgi:hypothetical protein
MYVYIYILCKKLESRSLEIVFFWTLLGHLATLDCQIRAHRILHPQSDLLELQGPRATCTV